MDSSTYEEYKAFRLEALDHAKAGLEELFRKRFEEMFAFKLAQEMSVAPEVEPIFERKPY